ncbi:creatininase family protein, partial [Alkalibacillus haloalkaliphilus]|uniref:creatininase family protein n=1 Tax=Alkalibacillus haloalkaliphilus TaxID=94136 RepID=UPI000379C697
MPDQLQKYHFDAYTSPELKAIAPEEPVIILPVGAMEQHGPHLPIRTDAELGYKVGLEFAKHSSLTTLVLPSVWGGFSHHHMNFFGTISISQQALFLYVQDILNSLAVHGLKNIVLLNSHGGNTNLLKTVVDEVSQNQSLQLIYFSYWNLIKDHIDDIRESS